MKPVIKTTAILMLVLISTLPKPTWGEEFRRRPLHKLEINYQKSVLKGWRFFQTSYAEDGVACVTCHRSHGDIVPWAGAYPMTQVFDGSPYAVKTLRQIILEALDRHTDLPDSSQSAMADDIAAYITWWGDGQPIVPGRSEETPIPLEDMLELKRVVEEGRILFTRIKPQPCFQCHTVDDKLPKPGKINLRGAFEQFPK